MKTSVRIILLGAISALFQLILPLRACGADFVPMPDYPAQSPAIDTLRVGFLEEKTENFSAWQKEYPIFPDFYSLSDEDSVEIFDGRPEMKYLLWMQDEPAPLVFIVPGNAVSFSSEAPVALAQVFFDRGYSVATISSAMNWEFMESAASAAVPAYPAEDAKDVYNALEKLLKQICADNEGKVTDKILVGYSLGALHTLFMADLENQSPKIGFKRFIAINPPVVLSYSINKIDEFYDKWRYWTPGKLQGNMNSAADAYFRILQNDIAQNGHLDIKESEAEFIIGYSFRILLSETIFSLYKRGEDMGNITQTCSWFSREKVYEQIRGFSFNAYVKDFVAPYYSKKMGRNVSVEEMACKSSLKAVAPTLASSQSIRIFHNADDFLVSKEDMEWLCSTVPENRLTIFEHGGHLGNLYIPMVQKRIVDAAGENPSPLISNATAKEAIPEAAVSPQSSGKAQVESTPK